MGLFLTSTQVRRIISLIILLILLYTVFFLATIFIIRNIFISQIKTSLYKLTNRVNYDLQYVNGKLDTTLYNADPLTPHPTGSSGFTTPLYIITTDGFVIERNQTISGLLDTSDYKRLITFTSPQTINAITNEKWRVFSRLLTKNNVVYGVAMVSYFNPITSFNDEIDQKLTKNLDTLISQIQIVNSTVKTKNIDIRDLDYDISFEVVDKFNKVLANNGRTPSFIDPSYVDSIIKNEHEWTIEDINSHENFYIVTQTLFDNNKNPRAIVVAGESVDFVKNGLMHYVPFSVFMVLLGTAVGVIFIMKLFNIQSLLKQAEDHEISPQSITFTSNEGKLQINNEVIDIPVDSHQHKLLHALFSSPEKIWSQEDLLEHFHESGSSENSRKIYDAMLAVNKKASFKLIVYKEKLYRIEPSVLNRISK